MRSRALSRTLSLVLASLVASSTFAASLVARDPLAAPAPPSKALALPDDPRPAVDKLVPELWESFADERVTARVLVTLHEPVADDKALWSDADRAEAIAAVEHSFAGKAVALGASGLRGFSASPVVALDATVEQLIVLAALAEVHAIEPNRIQHVFRSEGAALMRVPQLRSQTGAGGAGVGVAVLDSGVDASHPELSSRVVLEGNFTPEAGSGANDVNGHGTAVAGIIAGTSGGMAPAATIWAARVCNNDGACPQEQVIAALDAIYEARAEAGGLDLVNLSLGGGKANAFCDADAPAYAAAVNRLVNAGIAVFAASGNDGFVDGVSLPSCLSNTISVGAVADASFVSDACGPVQADTIMCYSNSGVPLDLLAPSECARTPKPGGGFESCFNGTSAATPYAAGVAALLKGLKPGATVAQLESALVSTGRPLTDVNAITRNRVDAPDAWTALNGGGGGGGGGGGTGPCTRNATTACLIGNRFEVRIQWTTPTDSGAGSVMSFGSQRAESDQSVFYWFFNPANFEMGIKMVNACAVNNHRWVFVSGLTNQGFEVVVRDTVTGVVRRYANPLGSFPTTEGDTSAFPCS